MSTTAVVRGGGPGSRQSRGLPKCPYTPVAGCPTGIAWVVQSVEQMRLSSGPSAKGGQAGQVGIDAAYTLSVCSGL
jgi:hypothetical protein